MVAEPVVFSNFFEQLCLRNLIDFAQNNNVFAFIGVEFQKFFIMDGLIGRRSEIDNKIAIPDRFECLFKHVLIQQFFGLMEPRGIDKNYLIVVMHDDGIGAFARSIGFLAE